MRLSEFDIRNVDKRILSCITEWTHYLETGFPDIEKTAKEISMAREIAYKRYQNEPQFHSKVSILRASILQIIKQESQ